MLPGTCCVVLNTPPHVRGKVLVVDDEHTITDVVGRYLRAAGYETITAHDGRGAVELARREHPTLMVLDLMLPGMDGLEVMRSVRAVGEQTPIILLTARGDESDRVVGLRLGADDYLVKPFFPSELVARVDAVLRRADLAPDHGERLSVGLLTIDPGARRVWAGEDADEVELTGREFDLLLFLARHPGQVFSREQLMDAVWHHSFYTDTSTVTVHIRRLRAKIEAAPAAPRHLQTVWGVGYRLEG